MKNNSSKKEPKDKMFTFRFTPEERAQVDELAALVFKKTGVEVTPSWVMREFVKVGYPLLFKKYKDGI
jgi:hypothetical protein